MPKQVSPVDAIRVEIDGIRDADRARRHRPTRPEPAIYRHINPYGTFNLDLDTRLALN